MANLIRRFQQRRHDKLKLWILLLAGVAVPIFLCWGLPNLLAAQRDADAEAAATATAEAVDAFRAANPEIFALCESVPTGTEQIFAAAEVPADPNILIIQYERPADLQHSLSQAWRYDPSRPANVVVCLEREVAVSVDTCSDGYVPDLSAFQVEPQGQQNPNALQEQVSLMRYAIQATIYDAATGEIIVHDRVIGTDPPICADPGGSLSGERVTPSQLDAWLFEVLGS